MENVITTFYTAFNNCDAKTMNSCYHDEIIFEDPAFGVLKGERAKAMWLMLCESQKDKGFKVEFSEIQTEEKNGTAYWEAFYIFSKTGRQVHNKVIATFEFKKGLIIKHKDEFNLHKWAQQALGFKGLVFGGFSFFKNKLQRQTNYHLDTYIKRKKLS